MHKPLILTVEKLRKAGNKVRVTHMREVMVEMVKFNGIFRRTVSVPANMRNLFEFEPCGGSTIIEITMSEERSNVICKHVQSLSKVDPTYEELLKNLANDTLVYVSICHPQDNFCYKTGVAAALSQIPEPFKPHLLGHGI